MLDSDAVEGTATNMARRYGRSPRGQRLDGPVPHGHWKTTTLVAGLTSRGFIAPYVTDGARHERPALPRLDRTDAGAGAGAGRHRDHGHWTALLSSPAHKVAGVRKAIQARGASLLYLPPYSPDLNPIEQAFAKLKALLRKAAERTVSGLWSMIGKLLDHFTPRECANYLANSGYPRSA